MRFSAFIHYMIQMPECKIPGLSWIYNLSGIIAGACDYFTFFRTYRQSAGFSPAPDHVPCFSGSVSDPPRHRPVECRMPREKSCPDKKYSWNRRHGGWQTCDLYRQKAENLIVSGSPLLYYRRSVFADVFYSLCSSVSSVPPFSELLFLICTQSMINDSIINIAANIKPVRIILFTDTGGVSKYWHTIHNIIHKVNCILFFRKYVNLKYFFIWHPLPLFYNISHSVITLNSMVDLVIHPDSFFGKISLIYRFFKRWFSTRHL